MRGAMGLLSIIAVWINKFQSARPMRGAIRHTYASHRYILVSIRAPHEGRDALISAIRDR